MKNILLGFLTIILSIAALAQENDTATLAKNKVAVVKRMQFVHAFKNNKDTCLLDLKKYDTRTRMIYNKIDMHCMGMDAMEESILTYGDRGVSTVVSRQNDLDFSKSTYVYDNKGKDPKSVRVFYYQTNDSMTVNTTYYKNKKGRLDSSETLMVLQDGSKQSSKNIARYNKNGELVQLFTIDSASKPVQMASYELDEDGRMLSAGFATYGEKEHFVQTYYQYNEKGQIVNTVNTVNQKQAFFYYENGLLKNILSYNPKGVLEIEYIFLYEFHK